MAEVGIVCRYVVAQRPACKCGQSPGTDSSAKPCWSRANLLSDDAISCLPSVKRQPGAAEKIDSLTRLVGLCCVELIPQRLELGYIAVEHRDRAATAVMFPATAFSYLQALVAAYQTVAGIRLTVVGVYSVINCNPDEE